MEEIAETKFFFRLYLDQTNSMDLKKRFPT